MSKLLNKINTYNSSSIGLDIIFAEKDRTSPSEILSFYDRFFNIKMNISGLDKSLSDNDLLFAKAIKDTNSVLSVYMSNEDNINKKCDYIKGVEFEDEGFRLQNSKHLLCNTAILNKSANNFGFINTTNDLDGILRRMPLFRSYNDTIIPTFALSILLNIDSNLKQYPNHEFEILGKKIRSDEESNVLLSYYDDSWYKKVSAIDVLTNNIDKALLSGKIVILGSSAVALHDRVIVSNARSLAGVQVHVTLIDNILNNELLIQPKKYESLNMLISFMLSIFLIFLLFKEKNVTTIILFAVFVLISFYINLLSIENGVYISYAYFILPLVINFFLLVIFETVLEMIERKIFVEELNKSHIALLDSMVHVAEIHDIETGAHIIRTKEYVRILAQYIYDNDIYKDELSTYKIDIMYRTASLHDLGKVGIPDSILKKPGKLTDMEFEVMKTHPELGVHIINNAIKSYTENDFFTIGRNIANYHHEKWDGTGYPSGLKGEEIPIEARLMAIADVYDALMNKRVYKKEFSYDDTIKIIVDSKGKHFDPLLVEAFLECQEDFRIIGDLYADENFEN
jgi:adenylate cyclase